VQDLHHAAGNLLFLGDENDVFTDGGVASQRPSGGGSDFGTYALIFARITQTFLTGCAAENRVNTGCRQSLVQPTTRELKTLSSSKLVKW
jgi:hypothetical protein